MLVPVGVDLVGVDLFLQTVELCYRFVSRLVGGLGATRAFFHHARVHDIPSWLAIISNSGRTTPVAAVRAILIDQERCSL